MDSTPSSRPHSDRSPSVVGPFTIRRELARGQLAVLYLAESQDGLRTPVVVKRLRAELTKMAGWAELLFDEARLLGAIRHPNVVALRAVGSVEGPYVALEYIEGVSLEQLLQRTSAPPTVLVAIVAELLRALSAVHAARGQDGGPLALVHQAPRPRHILLTRDGGVKLIDFTQARARTLAPSSLRRQRLRAGSTAPEQLGDTRKVDARSDLFIAGMTMWEALTGRPLFESRSSTDTRVGGEGQYPRPSSVNAALPSCFDGVCLRALAREPNARFASADEMLDALLAAARVTGGLENRAQIARWVREAQEEAARPAFTVEVSGSYPKPPERAREPSAAAPVNVAAALSQPPTALTQEMFTSARPAALPVAARRAPRFEHTMDGLTPFDPNAPVQRLAEKPVESAKAPAAFAKTIPDVQGAGSLLWRLPNEVQSDSARDARAAAQAQGREHTAQAHGRVHEAHAQAPGETRAARGAREPVAQSEPTKRDASEAAGRARTATRPAHGLRHAERRARWTAGLFTIALIASMLVLGAWSLGRALPAAPAPDFALPPGSLSTDTRAGAEMRADATSKAAGSVATAPPATAPPSEAPAPSPTDPPSTSPSPLAAPPSRAARATLPARPLPKATVPTQNASAAALEEPLPDNPY